MKQPRHAAPSEAVDPFDGPGWGPGALAVEPGAPPPERRRRRMSRRRQHRRRRIRLALLVVGGLAVVAAAWLVVTGLRARSELTQVRADLVRLRAQIDAGNLIAARSTAATVAGHARRAHDLTTGPVWAAAAALPWVGDPADTVRVATTQVDALGRRALPELVAASRGLDPARLRRPDGTFNVARIAAAAPMIERADHSLQDATSAVRSSTAGTWLAPVDDARRQLLGQLTSLTHTVHSVDTAAGIAPKMLGGDGVRRYFMAFQNNAEARGTG